VPPAKWIHILNDSTPPGFLIDAQTKEFMQHCALSLQGSGHTVPEYKPAEALKLYKAFLDGVPL
jgi:hypothetical protein